MRRSLGQHRFLDRNQRQSHIDDIGDRCPDTLDASYECGTHGKAGFQHRPCKSNATARAVEGSLGGFCVCGGIGLVCYSALSEGAHVNSTLKIQSPETVTLLEKIKIELKKRADAKSKRMPF
jgi:hypothetical protein